MSLITTWGYAITEMDSLPRMMDVQDYSIFTGRRDDADRVLAEIAAASTAIRNFVGWHLYPNMACRMTTVISDRRITARGRDLLIQLPARYVTEVTAVNIGGTVYTDYTLNTSGLLWVYDVSCHTRRTAVTVDYVAGLPDTMMAPIHELIASRVTHAIAVPAGITSEASGGVSVTYNAGWINNTRATALPGDNKDLLIPYKVQGVF